ncbi:MAG: SAM-dependent methyltransferase [Luteolibacter sp.]
MIPENPMPAGEFMRRALHDPRHGYYARRIPGVGRRGDFTTAPMLDATLARAVAGWAAAALRETGCRHLMEIGPGEGVLAAAMWERLPWTLRWKTRLHLVETSAPLREIQRQRLGRRASWHEHPSEALAGCGGGAVIFSNELVDAFPARVFEKTAAGWREVAVAKDRCGRLTECLLEVGELPQSSSFAIDHPVGQRVEIHESYRKWLQSWLPLWRGGRMLTVDYGATAENLYHRRPRGTLRAYLMQQRLTGIEVYQNPGRQDLTADVNFTDLLAWSGPWTRDERLAELGTFAREHGGHADAGIFTAPGGPGEAFLTLDQACGGSGT